MEHVLCSVIEFEDGDVIATELHRGSLESCEFVAARIPAVTGNFAKKVTHCSLRVPTADDFDEAQNLATPSESE